MTTSTTTPTTTTTTTTITMKMVVLMMMMMLTLTMEVAVGMRRFPGVVHFKQDRHTNHTVERDFRPGQPSRGYVGNCLGGFYDVSWEPKDVGPADRIQFYGNVVLPVTLDRVHIIGELLYEGTHMLTINRKYTCSQLAEQLNEIFPQDVLRVECPLQKGQLLSGSLLFTDTEQLIGYDGHYDLNVKVKDINNRDVMCIEAKVNVLPSDY